MTTLLEANWDLARIAARASVSRLPSEVVSLADGIDRTLAKDLLALVDLPSYETSAMDGYAVSGDGPWKIVGIVKAGSPMTDFLESGTAVRIATGAVIPSGTFGVVRWELAEVTDETLNAVVNQGGEIRPAGLECRKDQVISESGTVLTPAWIGLLASAGWDTLEVTRRPRVEIILLGDEIQLSGIPENGLVRDALGPQLPGWLTRMGADVVAISYVADELQHVVDAITLARTRTDLIVTTGGTADGPRDYLHSALEIVGAKLIVDRVKVRPGHPMLLANFDSVSLIGLPGNPQSAIVGLMSLGQPLIDALLGRPTRDLENVITGKEIGAREDFTRLVLGNINSGVFHEGDHLGSAMLRGLAHATGFAVAHDGVGAAGSQVEWLPFV
jgi:molybdopterin molybdotransferase